MRRYAAPLVLLAWALSAALGFWVQAFWIVVLAVAVGVQARALAHTYARDRRRKGWWPS